MRTSASCTNARSATPAARPIISVAELPEASLLDHTSPPDPQRTRDYRYYQKEFGADGFSVAYIRLPERHLVNAANLDGILLNTRCRRFGIGALMGRSSEKGGLLRDSLAQFAQVNALGRKYPHVLAVGIWGESETHCYRELPPCATPRDVYEHYRRMMLLDPVPTAELRQTVERLLAENPRLTVREVLSTILGISLDPAIEIHTCPDKVYGIHPHFALGADLVHMERSGWNSNCNLAIAFLRGGAREYGKKWALNMSPWGNSHTYARAGTAYDGNNRHVNGNSAELHWFNNISALLAGADEICHAGNETMFFRVQEPTLFGPSNCDHSPTDVGRHQDPGETGALLTPAGEYARRLARLIRDPAFDRGTPVVPVALMVELWHGWDGHHFAAEDWAWAGKVPVHRGDRMVSALFELFFPGHSLSGRAHDWTCNPDVPFESEFEMMKMLYAGMDMRRFETGVFVPTPFGDSFDVVTDQVRPDVLQQYPVTILAGRLSLTPENLPRLREYVEAGGTLVLHGMGLGLWEGGTDLNLPEGYQAQVEAFIGCRITNLFAVGYFPSVWCATSERFREGKYEYTLVEPTTAVRLAEGEEIYEAVMRERADLLKQAAANGDKTHPRQNKALNRLLRERRENYHYSVGNGTPLVTENQVGAGRVVFCAAHHHLTAQGRQLVKISGEAIHRLVDARVPVRIHGRPVQFHVNRTAAGYLIGLFNWSEQVWNGRVELRDGTVIRQVTDLLNPDDEGFRPIRSGSAFRATVRPYDIGLFKVQV